MDYIKKLIDTFKYGSEKTRRYLLIVVALTVASVAVSVLALVKGSWTYVAVAFALWVALIIVAGSKELHDKNIDPDSKDGVANEGRRPFSIKRLFSRSLNDIPEDDTPAGTTARELRKEGHIAFTDAEMKYLLKYSHAARIHRTVLIDNCESQGIKECPAFLWRDRRRAYFLLLLPSPKRIMFPVEQVMNMTYKRAVIADERKDYLDIVRTGAVNVAFGQHLPEYYNERMAGKIVARKNLYCLGKDLYVTAGSVKNVMEVLNPRFEIHDEITEKHNEWFNECYRYTTLWRDKIYTGEEYKTAVLGCLKNMSKAEIPFDDFRRCLEGLVEYHIINDEMADKIADYRSKQKS